VVSRLDIASASEVAAPPESGMPEACPTFGPIPLSPAMSPMRAILRTTFAPLGSARMRYEIALANAAGQSVWEQRSLIGSSSDDASIVRTTDRVMDFDIKTAGEYQVLVRFEAGSMDDLREATLELRRNVAQPDPRLTWGFGIAAALCLAATIVASRRAPPHYAMPERREAA